MSYVTKAKHFFFHTMQSIQHRSTGKDLLRLGLFRFFDRFWRANGVSSVDRSTDVPAYNTTGALGFAYSMKYSTNGTGSSLGQPIELTDTGVSQFVNGNQYTFSFYANT